MVYIIQTALQLGCVYSFVALALFLSFRILNIADLTTDGAFVLGMAMSVNWCAEGHPVTGLLFALFAGGVTGFVTSTLQTRMGVPSILAGIITNTGLYTVNLMVMGWSSNLSLLKKETVFTLFKHTGFFGSWNTIVLCIVLCIVIMLCMKWFLSTRLGLSIRATGDNLDIVSASSVNPKFTITIGLILSNMLTAFSGGLAGQLQKSADINAGNGIVTIGLATLVIGETLTCGRKSVGRNIAACIVGNVIYRCIYAIVLSTQIIPVEGLKLMTAFIVAFAIAIPYLKKSYSVLKRERREV